MSVRVLIFIVAYNHEKEIRSVLSRIPEELASYDTEVLIIDDASDDNTFNEAIEHDKHNDYPFKLTILHNPVNQGYGGNQKIGFRYAIDKGFDVVALVHGDGQYAPEKLPELLSPAIKGEADAVFGSRMLIKGGALEGGMPLYKYVGNKILTTFQNFVIGANLSEFHSGYRVYRTDALAKIPFFLNTPDFHFDTEIIIQFLLGGLRIKELPIPTYYGDEICHVNGLRYAKDVFRVTAQVPLHKMGLLYQRKFDLLESERNECPYDSKLDFDSSHSQVVSMVPANSRVLDIGCSSGVIARALVDKGCSVTGIDYVPADNDEYFEAFHVVDLDKGVLPVKLGDFDYILLLDVIEHLKRPEEFVEMLYRHLGRATETNVIVTTGNVAFFMIRAMLAIGGFNYGPRGILDLTHSRLFTFRTLRTLFLQRGFEIVDTRGIPAPYPLAIGRNWVAKSLLVVNRLLIALSKGFWSYQMLLHLKPLPSLEWLLEEAHTSSSRKIESGSRTKRKQTRSPGSNDEPANK